MSIKKAKKFRKKKRSGHIVAPGIKSYELTKLMVAESLLTSAIEMFFDNKDPVTVYLLAGTVREMLTTIGDKTGVETVLHGIAKRNNIPPKKLWTLASPDLGFFKHADRDPKAKLVFSESSIDSLLACACHDFGRITGGMPVIAQVFEVWIYALAFARVSDAPIRGQRMIKLAIKQFPSIRTADRVTQKRLGRDLYLRMKNDPDLQMSYSLEVQDALTGKIGRKTSNS